ncbi:hypothetical protein CANARDRAFT_29487 [[Candida] arabinofermentans NRRL YB-2248]|uniref:Large ribosomal subunit protein mL44 n=1 Tax=[Candida] arabinofermentans NRRL YB-2248 TaxID=983967 RepID=A0A1E4SX01_9ASCO|nr:hypothetical protein CANARDRAFT_29487 [[Candida] arabinofermentans NRRL YB-2248]
MSSAIVRLAGKKLVRNSLQSRNLIRNITSSAVTRSNNDSTSTTTTQKTHKFSYENAKKPISSTSSDLFTPENKLEFGSYQRKSTTLKVPDSEAKLIPSIITLHARLNLSSNYEHATLVRALTCPMEDNTYVDNQQMSLFGSSLLSFHVTEYLLSNYPRLPISILKNATEALIGDYSLYDVAKNSFGIEEDKTTNLEKFLSKEPRMFKFGKLRYDNFTNEVESGITKYNIDKPTSLKTATAYANSVRAIIAGIYAHDGAEASKQFIKDHILSRKIDISTMFQFNEPGKLLSRLLKTKKMESPVIRLISETGRNSNSPVFIVGCFSGDQMLSEGQGSSLKEARVRCSVNALKAYYLYSPLDAKLPSDEGFNGLFVDEGESFY